MLKYSSQLRYHSVDSFDFTFFLLNSQFFLQFPLSTTKFRYKIPAYKANSAKTIISSKIPISPKTASGTISNGLSRYTPAMAPKMKILSLKSQVMPSPDHIKLTRCLSSTGKSRRCSRKLRASPEYLRL